MASLLLYPDRLRSSVWLPCFFYFPFARRRMDDQDPSTKANVSPEKAEADFRRRFQHARQDLVRQLIIRHFKAKTKINSDAQKMMTELVRLFVLEACGRAAEQACEYQGVTDVTPEHLQQILPQLLFDFT